MIAFTCPHCGGSVRYDISSGAVKCEYCDGLITQDAYNEYLDKKGLYQTVELCCPQCGATVLSYDNTITTFCSYCGSSVTFDKRIKEEQKPDGILPFRLRKETAQACYRQRVDGLLLAPDWMQEEGKIHMTGLYVPYYLYNAKVSEPLHAEASQSQSYGDYTNVSVYEVSGTVEADYRGNRFDAAMAFPDAMSESIDNFDWQKVRTFEPAITAGFYADGSDVDAQEYDPVAARLISDDVNGRSVNYSGMSIPLAGTAKAEDVRLTRSKALLPVWLLTHRVKDRVCYAAVNGDSGDVAADIPLDRWKYLKVSLIVAAIFSLILNFSLTITPHSFLTFSLILTSIFGVILGNLARDVYVRKNHLDDIGMVGYRTFASSVKKMQEPKKQKVTGREGRWLRKLPIYLVLLFAVWPMAFEILTDLFSFVDEDLASTFIGLVILTLIGHGIFSFIRRVTGKGKGKAGWRFSVPKGVSFAMLWKIWLALAAGAVILIQKPVDDWWYYGAGALNILVSLWSAFDVISKQNELASRDIPVFTMKRGGES